MVDGDDPWFWFCYDDRWRVVAVFRAADEDPKEVFVHHNAGLAGYGGSSYIDSVILRDRDTSAAWHEEADDTRSERVYYTQNWRGDVSALLTDTGSMIEWVKYSAYGVPYSLPAGDTNSDGTWDAADEGRIAAATSYNVRYDANLDGVVGDDDITHANSIAGGYQTLGRGTLSSPAVANRVGYAGYRYDPTFKGASRTIYHVRHRVYDADVGRWTRRDPLGYVDGMSLYEYVRSRPVIGIDPRGTDTAIPIGGIGVFPIAQPAPSPPTNYPPYTNCRDWAENTCKRRRIGPPSCQGACIDVARSCCEARPDPRNRSDCAREGVKALQECARDPDAGRYPLCYWEHCRDSGSKTNCVSCCSARCGTETDACLAACDARHNTAIDFN